MEQTLGNDQSLFSLSPCRERNELSIRSLFLRFRQVRKIISWTHPFSRVNDSY